MASQGRPEPKFKNGICVITDYAKRNLELPKYTWNHIIQEKRRDYFEPLFGKIVDTLRKPDVVKKSSKEENVVIYERRFDDFYITDTFLARAYVNVIVNWKTRRIRTVYPSKKRKRGRIIWPQKR